MSLSQRNIMQTLGINLLLALLYIVTGWLSLQISSINDFTAVIFFPAGIALAGCLSFRLYQVLPGIVLGSYLLNLLIAQEQGWGEPLVHLMPLIIAFASALQATVGSLLLKRFVSAPLTLSDDREILLFIAWVPVLCLISATVSVSSLYGMSEVTQRFLSTWSAWWVGDALGVLITLPVMMSFIGQPQRLWRSRRWLMGAQLGVSLLVIVILTFHINQIESHRLEDRFRIRTQEAATLFQVALRAEELIQESVAQLFVSSSSVTRKEFSDFVSWATSKNQHIQVVEWLPKVTHEQRAAYEAEQQAYYGSGFTITELVDKDTLGPAKEREVYFPITYLEPEWDNKPARGFDPMSSPSSKQLIESAIETGQAYARAPLHILRDHDHVSALIIYRGVYQREDGMMTLDPAKGEIAGLINIVIRVEEFIEAILQGHEQRDFTLSWRDEESGAFYYQQPESTVTGIRHEIPFELARREMRLVFSPTERFLAATNTNLAVFALIGGFLLAGLFSLLFLSITGRTHRIATEVSLRTEELSEASSRAQESERKIRDVLAEMRVTEDKLRLSDVAFNSTSEAMMITDEHKKIIAVNTAFSRITGYDEEEVIGEYPDFLVQDMAPAEYQKLSEEFTQAISAEGIWRGEIQCRHQTLPNFPAYVSMSAVYDRAKRITNMVAVFSDITEVKEAQAKIERHANYDILTDLPNRRLFTDRLQQAILHSGRHNERLCLMFLDLDRFKDVNDTLGHEVGDELLRQMAFRIRQCVREVDTVARLGGDEFTIILSAVESKSHAVAIAQKLIHEIEQPLTIKEQTLRVTTSIGVTFYPDDAEEAGMLIQNADRSMYAAKDMGGSAFKFYTSELESSWRSRTFIISELEAAIERGELEVFYQPLLAVNSDDVCISAEALVRWQHPQRGLIPPAEFLPQAERMGMIEKIDDYVFRQVCLQIKNWQQRGIGDVHVSVNRSAHNFANQRGRLDWLAVIREQGIDASLITLEITESALMQRHAEGRHLLKRLRQADVQIAVDDFGTGYSSLSYLKEMDVDYLKIDRSFIRDLESDENDRAIIEAITGMARHLGIEVIAEGVETLSQQVILQQIGCQWLQGYLFAKPLPVAEFERFVEQGLYVLPSPKKQDNVSS